jgi:hypothetical protein
VNAILNHVKPIHSLNHISRSILISQVLGFSQVMNSNIFWDIRLLLLVGFLLSLFLNHEDGDDKSLRNVG